MRIMHFVLLIEFFVVIVLMVCIFCNFIFEFYRVILVINSKQIFSPLIVGGRNFENKIANSCAPVPTKWGL